MMVSEIIKAIHIEAHIYPTTLQDTQAGKDELQAIRDFIDGIGKLAEEKLPFASHSITITEERTRKIKGGR